MTYKYILTYDVQFAYSNNTLTLTFVGDTIEEARQYYAEELKQLTEEMYDYGYDWPDIETTHTETIKYELCEWPNGLRGDYGEWSYN